MNAILTKSQTASLHETTTNKSDNNANLALIHAKTHKLMPYVHTAVKILHPATDDNAVALDELLPDWKISGNQLHIGCTIIQVPVHLENIHFLSGKFPSVYKLPETWSRVDIPKEKFYQCLVFYKEPRNNLLLYTLLPGANLVFPLPENSTNLQNIWKVLHCFENVQMHKPNRMSLLNSTKYIVARNFQNEVPDEEMGVFSIHWAYSVIATNLQFAKYQEMFLTKALDLSNILRFRYPDTHKLQEAFDQFAIRQTTQKTLKKIT